MSDFNAAGGYTGLFELLAERRIKSEPDGAYRVLLENAEAVEKPWRDKLGDALGKLKRAEIANEHLASTARQLAEALESYGHRATAAELGAHGDCLGCNALLALREAPYLGCTNCAPNPCSCAQITP